MHCQPDRIILLGMLFSLILLHDTSNGYSTELNPTNDYGDDDGGNGDDGGNDGDAEPGKDPEDENLFPDESAEEILEYGNVTTKEPILSGETDLHPKNTRPYTTSAGQRNKSYRIMRVHYSTTVVPVIATWFYARSTIIL
ncbi:hypothetical protein D915_004432 [Fasciola hepatica]|uniref:Uncharacterized protein n=1 Tax=Fasciola hepatica TaxID=6192 RepID=A0A4E0RUU7_FASHE|nr:hypothetical protein D915_004432 [Fasciola hepatica]